MTVPSLSLELRTRNVPQHPKLNQIGTQMLLLAWQRGNVFPPFTEAFGVVMQLTDAEFELMPLQGTRGGELLYRSRLLGTFGQTPSQLTTESGFFLVYPAPGLLLPSGVNISNPVAEALLGFFHTKDDPLTELSSQSLEQKLNANW